MRRCVSTLIDLLKGGSAHVQFLDALEEFPTEQAWNVCAWPAAHRLAIAGAFAHRAMGHLEFSRNAKHVSPGFPEGYWPKTPGPASEGDWDKSVQQFQHDLDEMVAW